MPHYLNFVLTRPNDLKMADIWNRRFIAATKGMADYCVPEAAPAAMIALEEDALDKLLIWEDRINAHKNFDLGAEMAKYEPSRPTE